MDPFDPKGLELPAQHDLQKLKSKRPPRPKGKRFLRGPVPLAWLVQAVGSRGRSLTMGLLLWHWAGMERRHTIRVRYGDLKLFKMNRFAAYRALEALESASLISVERKPGCSPLVTILDPPDLPTMSESDSRNGRQSSNSTPE